MAARHLVICRVGRGSLHARWLGDPETRSYDVWLDAVDQQCVPDVGDLARVSVGPDTTKWPRLARLVVERPEIDGYEAVWIPDDDLDVTPAGIEGMFRLFRELGLELAQPALAPPSYSSHLLPLQHRGFLARYTNFVEVMAPLFSRAALRTCLPSFDESPSGWGLDYVWPRMIRAGPRQIAILDGTPVVHTRPQGTGTWYSRLPNAPHEDRARLVQRYGATFPYGFQQYAGVLAGPDRLTVTGMQFFVRGLLAMPRATMWNPGAWRAQVKSLWASMGGGHGVLDEGGHS